MENEETQSPNLFLNPAEKLFNSDSDASLSSEASSSTLIINNQAKNNLDYSNYSKLFERKTSDESISAKSSSSFMLDDYDAFKTKLTSKRKLQSIYLKKTCYVLPFYDNHLN